METDRPASCRFFTPGDACRAALDAYRTAGERITPPPGEPWIVDGQPYATPSDFAEGFVAELAARLGLLALDRLGTFTPPEDRGDPWRLAYLAAPEKMHRIIADRETALRQDAADFLGEKMPDLPGAGNAGHNQATRSAGNAE